jgi:hypothetical protein
MLRSSRTTLWPHGLNLRFHLPGGRTKLQVTWELSAKKIDEQSCEYTNHTQLHLNSNGGEEDET